MRTSQWFVPTKKEIPNDAEIVSHQLMLRAGLIRRLASGLYSWLPLGIRVLRKMVHAHHARQTEVPGDVTQVAFEVDHAAFERFEVLRAERILRHAAVVFQRADRRHQAGRDRAGLE